MMKGFLTVIVCVVLASVAIAADLPPALGMVYHTTENSSLNYECWVDGKGLLQCNFAATSVRLKMNDADAEKNIADWRKHYLSKPDERKKDTKQLCETSHRHGHSRAGGVVMLTR